MWVAECGSTQDEARTWVESPSRAGRVHAIASARQRAGRGRDGRRWIDAPGASLALSVAVVGPLPHAVLHELPHRISHAVRSSLADIGIADVAVKHPNDLVARGRKVGGVIVDAQSDEHCVRWLIAGIGINVGGGVFEVDSTPAITLEALGANDVDVRDLARAVAASIVSVARE